MDGAGASRGLVSKHTLSPSLKAKLRGLPTSTYAITAGVLPRRGSLALPVSWDDQILQ